jgi:hypothetical protein
MERSVTYEAHECPSRDLVDRRLKRSAHPPDGIIELPPDWVCEILSPDHEKMHAEHSAAIAAPQGALALANRLRSFPISVATCYDSH